MKKCLGGTTEIMGIGWHEQQLKEVYLSDSIKAIKVILMLQIDTE
jgi:hypothetical protein